MKKLRIITLLIIGISVLGIPTGCSNKAAKVFENTKPYITISLNLPKTARYAPSFAIWCEDAETKKTATLFVTKKASKSDLPAGQMKRPYNLPVWFSVKEDDADSVSSATPGADTKELQLQIPDSFREKKLNIYIEANVSYDYNDYYIAGSKPEDAFYNDCNGQPSVIYKAVVDNLDNKPVKADIIGFGDAAGKDGEIHDDNNATT